MRYASKKEEKMGILPVMSPLFNLREICKQSALLEDHLNNPRKRCPDCIRKHFLTIEALYEEATSLDKKFEYEDYLDGKAQIMRDLQARWIDSKDTKKYHPTCGQISQELRVMRKEYAPLCFDVRKMASLRAPDVCIHMRLATLSSLEKEDREVERLVKPKPKKKPPRKDLSRKRVKVDDPDLENLGGGAGGDRDLSMNHKRVAKRVALRFALRMAQEKQKKKDPVKDSIVEKLKKDKNPRFDSEAGNKVTFYTAYNADPDSREYASAHSEVRKRVENHHKAESAKKQKAQKAEQRRLKAIRIGLKRQFEEDPRNFISLLQKGSKEVDRERFIQVLAEMTLDKDFKAGDLAGLSSVSKIEIPELDYQIQDVKSQMEVADDDLKAELEEKLSELQAQRDKEATEETRDVLSKRMGELIGFVDGLDLEKMFPDLTDDVEGISSEKELEETKKEDAINFLLGKSDRGRKAIDKDDNLKFFHELYKANKDSASEEQSEEDQKEAQETREEFISKLKDTLPRDSALKDSKAMGKLSDLIDLLGGLPEEDIEDFEEGYKASADRLTKTFTSEKSTQEVLQDLKKDVDDLFNRPLSDMKGGELGQAMAAAVMEANFLNDFDYGMPPNSQFINVSRDSYGKIQYSENEGLYGENLSFTVDRLRGEEGTDAQRRQDAFSFYSQKLSELDTDKSLSKNQRKARRLKYESALEGAYVSMLMEGDAEIPQGRSKVDPFFLEYAKQMNSQEAMMVVSELSRENNGLSPEEVRSHKRRFMESLSDEDFVRAVGGDSGPFSEITELLDPQYCPDIPMNGDSAGQKVPVADCPMPMPPEMRNILRDYVTTVSMDMYSIVPQDEKGYGGGGGLSKDKKDDKKETKFKGWLKSNKKALAKALLAKDEGMIAALFASMREANLRSLNLSEYIEDYNEDSAFAGDPNKYRARKIMELLDSPRRDEDQLIGLLEKIEEEINTNYRGSSFRFASEKSFGSHYLSRRMTSRMKAFSAQKIARKFSSNKPFIRGCLSSDPQGVSSMQRLATSYVDYQQRARRFEIGMRVYPYFLGKPDKSGVVVQIFPAIGMVDVQFPHGVSRYPVEDLVLDTSGDYQNLANTPDSIPGGRGVVPVSSGPSSKKVASRYLRERKNRRG